MNSIEKILESFKDNPERETHMKLLAQAFFDNLERRDIEYGGWGLDDKRPFGNSLVEPDLAEIIGWNRDEIWEPGGNGDFDLNKADYLHDLYSDLGPYLKFKWAQFSESTK